MVKDGVGYAVAFRKAVVFNFKILLRAETAADGMEVSGSMQDRTGIGRRIVHVGVFRWTGTIDVVLWA